MKGALFMLLWSMPSCHIPNSTRCHIQHYAIYRILSWHWFEIYCVLILIDLLFYLNSCLGNYIIFSFLRNQLPKMPNCALWTAWRLAADVGCGLMGRSTTVNGNWDVNFERSDADADERWLAIHKPHSASARRTANADTSQPHTHTQRWWSDKNFPIKGWISSIPYLPSEPSSIVSSRDHKQCALIRKFRGRMNWSRRAERSRNWNTCPVAIPICDCPEKS